MRSPTKPAPVELTPREQAFIDRVTEEHKRSGYPLDILSVRDAEDITKIPKDTIRGWIDRGAIRAWAVRGSSRALRVSLSEVRAASAGIRQPVRGSFSRVKFRVTPTSKTLQS